MDIIGSFAMQAFFKMVEEYDGKLGKDILHQILKFDWNYWHRLIPNSYQIDISNFMQKV
jgi:hypothetical protein